MNEHRCIAHSDRL